MTSDAIRESFLRYFERQRHTRVASSSLVPGNDPTLLFTNAGMNQFKDVFLGLESRAYTRATSAQKCVRAGGKHNDLDNVGRTARHHTFFEMLGNFSFGDYFKEEAIAFAWEFLTVDLAMDRSALWVTIFRDDDDAEKIWRTTSGLPADRIVRLGEKDNFWAMGDTGPQGPCSEIYIDRGAAFACDAPVCGIGRCDCDRFLEFWNLVFMQYDRDSSGRLSALPKPSIDTGMGLERISAILQGVASNWETDLIRPIIGRVEEITGRRYDPGDAGFPFRVIADHSRAATFLIADGVLPSNEWRGYVLRRILRRAIRFGRQLGMHKPFLADVADAVIARMRGAYPDLAKRRDFVLRVLQLEEERFTQTLATGLAMLDELMDAARAANRATIAGADAFKLYDTYGFPLELTDEVAAEHGFSVDRAGYDAALERQRELSRASATFVVGAVDRYRRLDLPPTTFVGYDRTEHHAQIVRILLDGEPVDAAMEGQSVELILTETPFYGESGGQVGDTGVIANPTGSATVHDTQKPIPDLYVHKATITEGYLAVGADVHTRVDAKRRLAIMRNHTATHLLHAALHEIVGPHAKQAGSLVAPDRLRFDFTHLAPVSPDELRAIQREVNRRIVEDLPVTAAITTYQDAIDAGAMALFGEKYGDVVRTICVRRPPDEEVALGRSCASLELCGGTHVQRTGEIGPFVITAEGSVASGIRRIEALTGQGAEDYIAGRLATIDSLARLLKAPVADVEARVVALQQELAAERKRAEALERELARRAVDQLVASAETENGVTLVAAKVDAHRQENLRELAEWVRDRLSSAIVVLGAVIHERPQFVATVTADLVKNGYHAGNIVKVVAATTGGGGGGRPEFAFAGGKDATKIDDALRAAKRVVRTP